MNLYALRRHFATPILPKKIFFIELELVKIRIAPNMIDHNDFWIFFSAKSLFIFYKTTNNNLPASTKKAVSLFSHIFIFFSSCHNLF